MLRQLVRGRLELVQTRTTLKKRIHSILAKYNHTPPCQKLLSNQGLEWLRTIELTPVDRLPDANLQTQRLRHNSDQIQDPLPSSVRGSRRGDNHRRCTWAMSCRPKCLSVQECPIRCVSHYQEIKDREERPCSCHSIENLGARRTPLCLFRRRTEGLLSLI